VAFAPITAVIVELADGSWVFGRLNTAYQVVPSGPIVDLVTRGRPPGILSIVDDEQVWDLCGRLSRLRGTRGLDLALRRLGRRLPILHEGTVLDGELVADGFRGTMPALLGSKRYGERLRFIVFDLPVLAGADLRRLAWRDRRERLELLAEAFEPPVELSPVVEPSVALARDMEAGTIEGLVIKDRSSPYRDGGRSGWFKVKDRSWYEREAWRFDRR
jgi:hypothetical protein